MKKVVYTCLFSDGTRKVDEPIIKDEDRLDGWNYIIFTNIPEKLLDSGWNPIKKPIINNNPIYAAKYYKWMVHNCLKDYDIAIYVDAYMVPVKDKNWDEYVNKLQITGIHDGIILLKHPERNCIYDECDAIYKHKKDKKENMEKIKNFLKDEGMPVDYGLCQGGLFIRDLRNKDVNKLCEELFILMLRNTYRDQAFLPYVYWKHGEKINAQFTKDYYKISGKIGNHCYI